MLHRALQLAADRHPEYHGANAGHIRGIHLSISTCTGGCMQSGNGYMPDFDGLESRSDTRNILTVTFLM